ncbi:conserved hypothetical protein [Ricinus communis]|uniref:Uncharacterized protein n=1 Tax=Ricinus communis TaxID=3988 RepID=B9S2L0_RICCO|nr:conserved hypothetical protein [Ricinus communis]
MMLSQERLETLLRRRKPASNGPISINEALELELSRFGETLTFHALKGLCNAHSPDLLFIIETKNKKGGSVVAWNNSVSVSIINTLDFVSHYKTIALSCKIQFQAIPIVT